MIADFLRLIKPPAALSLIFFFGFAAACAAEEERSFFTDEKWSEIISKSKKESSSYDTDMQMIDEGITSAESLIKKARLSKEAIQIGQSSIQVSPQVTGIIDQGKKKVAGVKKVEVPALDEEASTRIREEPIGIIRAREMIEKIDAEKARRLREIKVPPGRKRKLPGSPQMNPPGRTSR